MWSADYNAIRPLSKLIFHPLCRLCGRSLEEGKSFCFRCGKSLLKNRAAPAESALFRYREQVPAWLALLRQDVHAEAAAVFLRFAKRYGWLASLAEFRPELLVTAPQHRGGNWSGQASGLESVARLFADELEIPLVQLLNKTGTRRQHDLDFQDRMDADLFLQCSESERARGKRILLLDDVWTTGTTLEMGAYVLRQAGASEVKTAALARQVMPGLDRQSEQTEDEGDEVPVFLTHLFV